MKLHTLGLALLSTSLLGLIACSSGRNSIERPKSKICSDDFNPLSPGLEKVSNKSSFQRTTLEKGNPQEGETDLTAEGIYAFNGVQLHYIRNSKSNGNEQIYYTSGSAGQGNWVYQASCVRKISNETLNNLNISVDTVLAMKLEDAEKGQLENHQTGKIKLQYDPAPQKGLSYTIDTEDDSIQLSSPKDIQKNSESYFYTKVNSKGEPTNEFELRSQYRFDDGAIMNVTISYKLCTPGTTTEEKAAFEQCALDFKSLKLN